MDKLITKIIREIIIKNNIKPSCHCGCKGSCSISSDESNNFTSTNPTIYDISTLKSDNTQLFNEGKQVGTLYHFTNINSLVQIIQKNSLKPSSISKSISFTRNPKFHNVDKRVGLGSQYLEVKIVVDGDRLSNRYKIQPFNFFKSRTKHPHPSPRAEEEERVITNDNINNFDNYVISYDINIDEIEKQFEQPFDYYEYIKYIVKKTDKIKFYYKNSQIPNIKAFKLLKKIYSNT